MTVKGKDVIGLPVITIDTGAIIGNVKEIAFNPTKQRIVALVLRNKSMFKRSRAILMSDVHNIGQDAVVVPTASVVKTSKQIDNEVSDIVDSDKFLVRTNVLTSDGKALGNVTDIFFSSKNGKVRNMEVSQSGLRTITEGKKSITPSDIVTIGANATIVSTYTEMLLEEQGEHGGLKGAVHDARAKAIEATTTAKDAITEKSMQTKYKAEVLAADAKVSAQHLSREAQVKAQELSDATQAKAKELSAATQAKSKQLGASTQAKSKELRADAEVKGKELQQVSEQLVDITNEKLNGVIERSKEDIKHVKDWSSDQIDTVHRKRRKMVTQKVQRLEDADKRVEIKQTTISKK